MKLLVSTFSCCPGHGSEPGVGWHTLVELAREHEVWALVDENWERKVSHALPEGAPPRIHLRFVGIPLLTRLVDGPLNCGPAWLIYYYAWQVAQWWVARGLHREVGFDACQHVTFVKYNVPSLLPLLGLPFIWGPVGGAEAAPACFYREFDWKIRLVEAARVWLQRVAFWDPLVRWCHRHCILGLAVTAETAAAMEKLGARHVKLLPAVALADEELEVLQSRSEERGPRTPLTLLYVGRLLAWKGIHLGLRAMALCGDQSLQLRVIGDGPMRSWLEDEVRRLGLEGRVFFCGSMSREEVLRAYAQADGFLYPSLHDSGGNAVLEAMAAGLPVICLRHGGPHLLVDEDCGWKVNAATPGDAVTGLAAAVSSFATDAKERARRAGAAREAAVARHARRVRGNVLLSWISEVIAAKSKS